jgi:2,4-dienoyl-CoA reductase-like NADH-dependent reductase (Old Yellow Enzyme family)
VSAAATIERLYEPVQLGPVWLRNRIYVAPHTTNFGRAEENQVTDRHLEYHRARAAGGAGLIITEGIRVHPTSLRRLGIGAYDDAALPGLSALADTVHAEGGALFGQLLHTGRHSGDERQGAWGASAQPWATGAPVPHVMNRFDLATVREAFGAAARRLRRAGFDGAEVHIGHGHLLQQFLSPVTNTRTDAYGGSPEARLRLTREVLEQVVTAFDGELALGLRLSADEFLPGGLGPDEVEGIVAALVIEFPIHFLHVSHSAYTAAPSLSTQMADMSYPTAPFRHLPARFRASFPAIPVLAVCRLDDLEHAAALVNNGEADLVGFARAHIADPALAGIGNGSVQRRVRSCVACNQGCNANLETVTPITCTVNPEVGREADWRRAWQTPAEPRRVLVVGGGPAGLEAAATAARRGHTVSLWEREDRLGGTLAAVVAGGLRERFGLLIDELSAELGAVSVSLGRTADAAAITAAAVGGFDTVLLATGATPAPPLAVPGVRSVDPLTAVADLDALGASVAIFDELGGWEGVSLAEYLTARGARVRLISPLASWAGRVTVYSRLAIGARLAAAGMRTSVLRRPVRSDGGGLVLSDVLTGEEEAVESVDTLVHVAAPAAADHLLNELADAGFHGEVRLLGDAYAPRSCLEAVYEGRLAGVLLGTDDPALALALGARDPYRLAGAVHA